MSRRFFTGCIALATEFLLLTATALQAQELAYDWLIVPGESVGRITATTTEFMLKNLFPIADIERIDVELGEGFSEAGTVIFGSDPLRRIEILWRSETRERPKQIRFTGASSVWHMQEGLSLGSTLREIENLNGFPFRLTGFGWDYGGTIVDCGNGKLRFLSCRQKEGSGNSVQPRQMIVRLRTDAQNRGDYKYFGQVTGDGEFSSGHPAMQALNPRVYQIIFYFSP